MSHGTKEKKEGIISHPNPASVVIPVSSFSDSHGGDVSLANSYAIFTQATISFSGAGMAAFTLQGAVSPRSTGTPLTADSISNVPEPTSIFLLGSGLVGLGVLRKKRGTNCIPQSQGREKSLHHNHIDSSMDAESKEKESDYELQKNHGSVHVGGVFQCDSPSL